MRMQVYQGYYFNEDGYEDSLLFVGDEDCNDDLDALFRCSLEKEYDDITGYTIPRGEVYPIFAIRDYARDTDWRIMLTPVSKNK